MPRATRPALPWVRQVRQRLQGHDLGTRKPSGSTRADDEAGAPAFEPGLAPVRTHRDVVGRIEQVDEHAADAHVPAVVAHVHEDGGDDVVLIWLGRRHIGGIRAGVRVRARGLSATHRTKPAIFNPAYELLPQPRVEEQQ